MTKEIIIQELEGKVMHFRTIEELKDFYREFASTTVKIIKPWRLTGWQNHEKVVGLTVDEAYATGWNDCVKEMGKNWAHLKANMEKNMKSFDKKHE